MSKKYEVGYGKPPKHSQFKPNQSGNPKGRPKGRKNMNTIANEMLNRPVAVTENGRTRKVQFMEALSHKMAATALHGTMREQISFFKAFHDFAPELLKEAAVPTPLRIEFVRAKDGRPYYGDESEVPDENGKKSSKKNQDTGEESEDDDDSWLD